MFSLLASIPALPGAMMNGYGNYSNYGYGMMGGFDGGWHIIGTWIFGVVVFIDLVLVGIWLVQKILKK